MAKQIKFSYTLTGVVDLNEMDEAGGIQELNCLLDDLTRVVTGNGLITGDTEMTVDSYDATVKVESV